MPALSPSKRAGRPPRDVEELIRDLQRINLSQCLDQLYTDIGQLSQMERQLGSWTGLYVRCPGPEPDDLGCDPGDKKSSSGYSTESASPPDSRDVSDDAVGACAAGCEEYAETEVKRRLSGHEERVEVPSGGGFISGLDELSVSGRPQHCSVRLLSGRQRRLGGASAAELAGFLPAAASTPTQRPAAPRSPKTLRFAATAELIPPDSPSRLRVASGAPRHGILRTACHGAQATQANRETGRDHPQQETRPKVTPRLRRQGSDRVKIAVSALNRMEADFSGGSTGGRAYGTAQFVGAGSRRPQSPPETPRQPLEPLVVVRSPSDDTVTSLNGDVSECDVTPAARPQVSAVTDSSEHDLVRWRRAKVPPLRPARRRLAWLLSCASRRRPPSPSQAARLATPPDTGARPAAASVLYQCNLCGARFQEHRQVVAHVHERHQRVQVRPKYSCGLCPARFYASRFLAKHCAYHHMGMGDKRTPQCLKMRRIV